MFRLERLEIAGFKSFYDPAQLSFPSAVTAVVGPNGCGKSNICDAITWVLGESRASQIRGETMEDVIFQGSARRRALGMGEVTMTLHSSDNHPATDDGKLVINRRVFRTGESEFRLNGRRVRMKDIADILMDTGLGIRNYSVMEQGKIDLIISNKPQDRRKLIEEAAGITRYKSKRRAAEMKLEETQANLLRIDDTLMEVNRSLNSLKRQAAKARRHAELAEEIVAAKRSLYSARLIAARIELGGSESGFIEVQSRESEAAASLAREEADLAGSRALLTERSSIASGIREELARSTAGAERLRSFLEQSERSGSDLQQRLASARDQVAAIEQEAGEQQGLLEERSHALEAAKAERNRIREVSDELERTRQEKSDAVRRGEKSISELRESLMRNIARISEARNQVHQIEISVEKCEFYLGKLNETTRKASESRNEARDQAARWDQSVAEAAQQLGTSQQSVRDATTLRDSLTQRRDGMRKTLASSRDLISQTTYKIDSLRTLLTSLESQDEEVRRAIYELIPNATAAAESVSAAEGYEAALDVLLREISRAVVVDDSAIAVEAIGRLRERGAGSGAFIALDYPPPGSTSGLAARRGDAETAILGEGPTADAVRAAVPEAYVVDDLPTAIAQSRERPHVTFITREGDIVRGPLLYGGRQQDAQPGVFSIKRQVHDLEQLLGAEKLRASGIADELQSVEDDLRAADDARILSEERQKLAENELREKKAARDRVATELHRYEKDLAVASEESQLYEKEKGQLLARHDEAIRSLEALQSAEVTTQESIRTGEETLKDARAGFEEITDVASKARVELEGAIGNATAMQREYENLSRIVSSLYSRGKQLNGEIEVILQKQAETSTAAEQARSELDQHLKAVHELGERRVALEAEVADLQAQVAGLSTRATTAREEWNSLRDRLFEAERRVDRARAGTDLLREQVSLDIHIAIETLEDVAPPADEESRTALEGEVARLADQLEKIGPVNVLAIEEHRELEEREVFLRTQRDDLVQSIESLRSTIRKLNMTSRELFREAYTVINKSFGEIFTALFGGGQAAMQLLDEEDVLETGIELIAQPPGKKTQSIALLSGGERALTAIALLFSIFRYKPSPFCILDEVDAPLDEVNNERFVRLVRDMSRDTQFIMITHSRRTMEAADALYGVTMEEAGCSRLVSVSFADLEA